ncbi:MAG: branched-chain amino acid aminotransferase [Oribacterium sp.]|jgi:branched-chain amino acid aminotransferase|nr:branched-chain amino acid aminotransferase [Oribacterium sp.]MDY6307374.1 branched-chain amino acid aminotransferase [Oribacterium sp.]MDY6316597.1 branched-chain amino acid aminotransferase [Oribacterium sp.]
MAKKNLDWGNIGFSYMPTDKRYVSNWKAGAWDDGALIDDPNVTLNESAGMLQYCQQVFEGLKAYTWEDGSVVCFRPDLNAERIYNSAKRIEMPPFPKEKFLEAIDAVVKGNIDWVPPYGSGASLYIRPYEFATGVVIGVKPADEYQFRIFTTPVGPYYKGGANPIAIIVSDFDRAAPRGTGAVKAGLNYAMSLHSSVLAHSAGYAENLYLDPATRTYVEETGGSNAIFVDENNTLVVPKSPSILPSITRRSIVYVAEHYLHLKVDERPVKFSEIKGFKECGLCGTAAVISPVGRIVNGDEVINLPSGMDKAGEVIGELYDTLTGIQTGKKEAPEGWIRHIC